VSHPSAHRIHGLAHILALLVAGSGCGPSDQAFASDEQALTQACSLPSACDAAPPSPGAAAGFRKRSSTIKSWLGKPNHRVHDLLLTPGDAQWVIGTFAYDGIAVSNIEGEDVDVYLLRGCGSRWELLGTSRTTDDGEHATIEGVLDTGGHVYFPIPSSKALGLGRHRLRLVVRGDLSSAEGFIEVQPKGTAAFVSDIDGTLTTSELAELGAILTNTSPDANPGAAAALSQLAAAGYRPIYLSARTESELNRTRMFLSARGFPPGLMRTSQGNGLIGLSGSDAVGYKASEIDLLQRHGFKVALGIGNTDTDARAYQQTGVAKNLLYGADAGKPYGAQRFDAYASLVAAVGLPNLCTAQGAPR
jgi:hypothetical protein